MLNNFEVIIGIEVHTSLNTKTKMFSSSLNSHNSNPNTNINEIDLGLPGTMPLPNKSAVQKAFWLAQELNMSVNYKDICFDRKNYFYLDLPKGFQITQQYHPIAQNGYIEIVNEDDSISKIEIERFHLEEDTAKQFSQDNKIYLDYNRCGCPLIEIVSKPCIRSAHQAGEYLKNLIQILKYTNISDAKLEEGSLRADVNISIRPYGQKEFGTKVEIKNINSVSNVMKAIEFEINRQAKLILSNNAVIQETRRFDDKTNETVHMRDKSNAVDYRYIYEPNILHISLSDDEYNSLLNNKPESIKKIKETLFNKLNDKEKVNILLNNFELYNLFELINSEVQDANLIYNWLVVELMGILNKQNIKIEQLPSQKIPQILQALKLLNEQELNGKQLKVVFEQIITRDVSVQDVIKEFNMQQIKDPEIIATIIQNAIKANPEMLNDYATRPERTKKFFIGLVMKETKAQANPVITDQVLTEILSRIAK